VHSIHGGRRFMQECLNVVKRGKPVQSYVMDDRAAVDAVLGFADRHRFVCGSKGNERAGCAARNRGHSVCYCAECLWSRRVARRWPSHTRPQPWRI
jgi:hypothetical protein